MGTCPSCNADIAPGTRWCGLCHVNTVNPQVGRLASPGKRLAAYVLDLLIPAVSALIIVTVTFVGAATGGVAQIQSAPSWDSGYFLLMLFGRSCSFREERLRQKSPGHECTERKRQQGRVLHNVAPGMDR